MSRTLLIGGSYSALPFAREILRSGSSLWVVGNNEDEPAHSLANKSVLIDYSSLEAVDVIAEIRPDFIVPSANDRAYTMATRVADLLDLQGYDSPAVERVLGTKAGFGGLCSDLDLPAPRKRSLFELEELLGCGGVVMVKPTDAFSGIGVTQVTSTDEVEGAVERAVEASPTGEYVIEDYVQGSLHSHSMFLRSGQCAADFFVDEFCTRRPHQVNSSNYPSRLEAGIRKQVRTAVIRMAEHLNLVDGLVHTQFIVNSSGAHLIETMRRCPGDLFPSLVERSTGFQYSLHYVDPFLGRNHEMRMLGQPKPVARHTLDAPGDSLPWSVESSVDCSSWAFVPLTKSGDFLPEDPSSKAGIAFMEFENTQRMWNQTPGLIDRIVLSEDSRLNEGEGELRCV